MAFVPPRVTGGGGHQLPGLCSRAGRGVNSANGIGSLCRLLSDRLGEVFDNPLRIGVVCAVTGLAPRWQAGAG